MSIDNAPKKRFKIHSDRDVLTQARKDIDGWFDYWASNIKRARDDIYFVFVDQWDSHSRHARERKRQAVLQFNRLYTHVTQVLGEQRQNTPNLKVRANTPHADQADVDLREGILRQIFYQSKSNVVFQTAFRSALCAGFGAIQIEIDYESPKSFDLFPRILSVEDPTQVFFDPNAKEYDKSDSRFCGKYVTMQKADFERRYPNIKNFDLLDHNTSWGGIWGNYGTDESVTIADYYVKEYYTDTIVKLSDGRIVPKREADYLIEQNQIKRTQVAVLEGYDEVGGSESPLEEVSKRETELCRIMHYKLIRNQILEKSEWPCDELPFKYVDGDSSFIDGQQRTRSFIESAKDAQRLLNYSGSEMADSIVNATRSQWIGTPGNLRTEEQRQVWQNPDLVQGMLLAERDSQGQLPTKIPPSQLSPALIEQYKICEDSIPHNLGRYQANLGAPSNEQSGIAISNRAQQGNNSTFVYFDNLNRAVESTGKTLLKLLPTIFDNTRHVILRKEDGEQKAVQINQPMMGKQIKNRVDAGDYNLEIITGPNYEIQKAQALEQLISLARIAPQSAPLLMDLIAANIDVENMPQLVERLKTLVPPQVIAKEKGENPPPQQPNPQAMLMQQEIKNKMIEQQVKQQELQQNAQRMALNHEQNLMKYAAQNTKSAAEIKKAELEYEQAAEQNLHHRLQQEQTVADRYV